MVQYSDAVFDVYVVKEEEPPTRFGAFRHDPARGVVPYGDGKQPERATFTSSDLVLTGQDPEGDSFEIRLAAELLQVTDVEKEWGASTFWLTDGQRLIGIRVGKSDAARVESLLKAYTANTGS